MMTEPNVIKCPECGTPLSKKKIFNETVVQCPSCEYKQVTTSFNEKYNENILEESR